MPDTQGAGTEELRDIMKARRFRDLWDSIPEGIREEYEAVAYL